MTRVHIAKQRTQQRLQADGLLLLAAGIWGLAFVAQRLGSQDLGYFMFNGLRFLVGAFVLLPFLRFKIRIPRGKIPGVLLAGILLFAGSNLQQAGIAGTTAGQASFLTSVYVVLVPVFWVVFWRRRLGWVIWVAALMAALGAGVMNLSGKLDMVVGNTIVLLSTVPWALQVIVVGVLVQDVDPLHFAVAEFLVCGSLSLGLGLLFQPSTMANIAAALLPVIYTGIFSVGVGFTLQAVGQRHAPPAEAAIIMSLEAVFGALFGWWLLGERMTWQQITGCLLVFAAILLAQWQAYRPQKTGGNSLGVVD